MILFPRKLFSKNKSISLTSAYDIRSIPSHILIPTLRFGHALTQALLRPPCLRRHVFNTIQSFLNLKTRKVYGIFVEFLQLFVIYFPYGCRPFLKSALLIRGFPLFSQAQVSPCNTKTHFRGFSYSGKLDGDSAPHTLGSAHFLKNAQSGSC